MIRPSSLPMLAQCPGFAGMQSEFTDAGTDRHKAFAAALRGDESLLDFLDDEERDRVFWAVEYVRVHAPMQDYKLEIEKKIKIKIGSQVIEGTPDVACGPGIWDLKWRHRDYLAQMAAYALSRSEQFAYTKIHILFAESKYAEVHELTRPELLEIVTPLLNPKNKTPHVCDYCGWCSKRLTCPALTVHAATVAKGYADDQSLVEHWHPSQMKTAAEIAAGLTIWRRVLKKWGESMEFHALDAAKNKGMALPGYDLKEKKGRQYVSDTSKAFPLSGLEANDFLRACELRMNTSKKYPDKEGIIDIVKDIQLKPRAQAKRETLAKLAPVLTQGSSSVSLVSTKDNEKEEE